MHQISRHLGEYGHFFTPYYGDRVIDWLRRNDYLEFSIVGNKLRRKALEYLRSHNLPIDEHGSRNEYELVVTCSDLIVPSNIRRKKLILVQEGMTDPEGLAYYLVKYLRFPRYIASTSTTGMSNFYDYFCVASEGYRNLFARKGADPSKIVVTGIPNYDNCAKYLENDFPYKHYLLAATSDARETFMFENRKKFIHRCIDLAKGRQVIFKLHPNENAERSTREILEIAPEALVFPTGNTDHMIANCDVLVTKYSTVVYTGMALGKEVYSDFDIDQLRELVPIQNGGTSAEAIADLCRRHIEAPATERIRSRRHFFHSTGAWQPGIQATEPIFSFRRKLRPFMSGRSKSSS